MVELLAQVEHHVLDDSHVHPHHIVQHLDAKDGQREDSLGEDEAARR